MITINKRNIEERIIASIEGLLTAEEQRELQGYIQNNAEAYKLYEEFQKTILKDTDTVAFPFKEELYRALVNKDNVEQYIIGHVEQLLTPSEESALSSYQSAHPEAEKLAAQYAKTILVPESITFPFKDQLYKDATARPKIVWLNRVVLIRIAAILVLGIVAFSSWKWLIPGARISDNSANATAMSNARGDNSKTNPSAPHTITINGSENNLTGNGTVSLLASQDNRVNNNFDSDTRKLLAAGKAYNHSSDGFAIGGAYQYIEMPKACQSMDCIKQANAALLANDRNDIDPQVVIRPRVNSSNIVHMINDYPVNNNDEYSFAEKAQVVNRMLKQISGRNYSDNGSTGNIKAIHISYNGQHFKFSKTIKLNK